MQRIVHPLPYVTQGLGLFALVAGLAAGLLTATVQPLVVCFDQCPTRANYFADLGPDTVWIVAPTVVLEGLAVVTFLTYCLVTRQPWRAVRALLVLLAGGALGVAALLALAAHAQATLPLWGDGSAILFAPPLEAWAQEWGWALLLVAGAWAGVLSRLQRGALCAGPTPNGVGPARARS
jgi:hypothetical protein